MADQWTSFAEFCGTSGGSVVVFMDDVRVGNAKQRRIIDPMQTFDEVFLADWTQANYDALAGTLFFDDVGVYIRGLVPYGPRSQVARISPQQQSSWFLALLARILQLQRPAVVDGPKALHRYVTVTAGHDPTLGQYGIFRDGLAVFSRETIAVFD
jgi:hypothetical protein